MLKVNGHLNKHVMANTLLNIRMKLYEEWGISNSINNASDNFSKILYETMRNVEWGIPQNPNIKHCCFEYVFWKKAFKTEVFLLNYKTEEECFHAKELGRFNSELNFKDEHLKLFLGAVMGMPYPPTYDDIIKHEIQHIYKIINGGDIKPSDKLLNNSTMFNEEFYNKLNDIILQTKEVRIRKIAYALYSSFEFERNGFIGGLDGVFLEIPNDEPGISYMQNTEHDRIRKLQSTGCYKAYENIIKVLNFIDDVPDDKIYNIFGYYKYKIKKVLEISKERYLKGMSKIIMKYSNIWGKERTLLKKIREGYNMGRFNTFTWIL